MKIYLFDDDLIISGANLSSLYFNNRADRYILIKNHKPLCDYYWNLIDLVGKHSYDSRNLKEKKSAKPNSGLKEEILSLCKNSEMSIKDFREFKDNYLFKLTDDVVYIIPTLQMKPFNIDQDSKFTSDLLKSIIQSKESRTYFASGYFNLIKEYQKIIQQSNHRFSVLTASPKANGFYESKGVSKHIPWAYSLLEEKFYRNARANNLIELREYSNQDWTFHAKGLWSFSPNFAITQIGSSNYGYRSAERDLENQLTLITKNSGLIKELENEAEQLFKYGTLVSEDTFQTRPRSSILKATTQTIRSML